MYRKIISFTLIAGLMAQDTGGQHSNQEILNAAANAIARGDMQTAQEIVAPLVSGKGLSIQQKLKLSHELQWLGLPVAAMKALGKLAATADFHLLKPEEFCLQVRAVYMLNFLGATYVARRMLEKIEEHLQANKIDLNNYNFSLDMHRAYIDYESARYSEALPAFQKMVNESKDVSSKAYFGLHLIACLEATDQEELARSTALEIFKEIPVEKNTLRAMYLQNMGRMEVLHGEINKATEYLDGALDLFGGNHRNKDEAYAILWQGIAKGFSGELEQAQKLLKMSWEVLHHPLSQPQAQLTVLYWMERLNFTPDLASQIALRSSTCINSFSFLLGKPIHEALAYPLHARIKREAKADPLHDAWLVHDGKIKPIQYSELDLNQFKKLLDLYSGVEKDDKARESFTEIQVRALIACLGAGPIGVHEYALVDFIYRQHFWDWQSGKERLKKLIQYLRKKGMPLTVRNQIHRLELEELASNTIIIPMALDLQGQHHFVSGHKSRFTRQELEEILGTKKTNASMLLKEWLEKKYVVEEDRNGPKVYYAFSDKPLK